MKARIQEANYILLELTREELRLVIYGENNYPDRTEAELKKVLEQMNQLHDLDVRGKLYERFIDGLTESNADIYGFSHAQTAAITKIEKLAEQRGFQRALRIGGEEQDD